ncbi:MAG TPA: HlyU family transcriptional regulator [Amaricoccus sp.]|uniref:HlyU family transcriptional regulator n=1 Tax=Amaricoccus sp. TaxID=1872485 RepID=UPI002BB08416|nr:HlyU family transcriptional regulator [Amaricoccus sp.]HMQ95020.1 HlyU family transcriptional regulator [Amaricoccus sp.]HMR52546.1 HlyU family transcriptional regulator [Amaricoccus sp.]HMR59295.1 HlyU family transcriptional regulator [Amaricoccus sp.]HMT99584.1 HlyU family transcriptional regulator [Amaricoccus sp.]
MSLLSRLFGGSSAPKPEPKPEIYKDFRIYADPAKEGSRFRITARIEKEIAGALKAHTMIRADTFESAELAQEMTLRKAKLLIDERGDKLFE